MVVVEMDGAQNHGPQWFINNMNSPNYRRAADEVRPAISVNHAEGVACVPPFVTYRSVYLYLPLCVYLSISVWPPPLRPPGQGMAAVVAASFADRC